LEEPGAVVVDTPEGQQVRLEADVTLLATGARPRVLPTAEPDGERILTWTQLYELTEVPRRLIVVGSGVTGAEFAGAYRALGAEVVLVSSRDRVLPGEDADAADGIEGVFKRRGMHVLDRSRAEHRVPAPAGIRSGHHRSRAHPRRPRLAHHGARHLRRRGRHRCAAAGIRVRHAYPDRHVSRPGRCFRPSRSGAGLGAGVHRT